MSEPVLTFLKFCLLAVLYLFLAVWSGSSRASCGARRRPRRLRRSRRRPRPCAARARKTWRLVLVEPAAEAGAAYTVDDEVTLGRALRPGGRLAQPRPRVHDEADRGRRERHAAGLLRPGALPLRLQPALAPRLSARATRPRRVRVAAAAHAPRDLGVSGANDARDDAGDARRRAGAAARAARGRPGSISREAADDPRLRLRRAGHGGAPAGAAGERRAARCASSEPTCPSARSGGTSATPSTSSRRGRIRASPTPCSRSAARRRVEVVLPQSSFDLPGLGEAKALFREAGVAVLVSSPRGDPALERQGRDLRDARRDRRARAGVAAGAGPGGGRRGGARARLSRPRRLHEAGLLVRVARLSRPLLVGRPARAAADEPARRRGGAAARGSRRAARPGRRDRAPRHGARDGEGAHDRRHRRRRADRARPSEDARGDARRARDVLRDARRPVADGDGRRRSSPSSSSTTSSTSSSSAST